MYAWLRQKAKDIFKLYDIQDLKVGGYCGCCGDYMPKAIVENSNEWSLCKKCKASYV